MSIKRFGWLLPVVLAGTLSASASGRADFRTTSSEPTIAALAKIGGNALELEKEKTKKRKPIVTPEPTSLLLFGTGMLGIAVGIRRKKNRNPK